MKRKHDARPIFHVRAMPFVLTFIFIIVTTVIAACNIPAGPPESPQEFSDKNARMYQMYFDSSADPAQNELQKRRFIGHLHLADIEDIFGDIQSLPMDDDCKYVGGPVLHVGLVWYVTISADLVGVNLISISPDGTKSSAFDLDGDRVVDILDIRLPDNRRISFLTEQLGLDVFRNWLQGLNPFCNTELIRQLGLPELGCDERGDGSSGGGDGFAPGSGIVDPFDMLCSEYGTNPGSQIVAGSTHQRSVERRESHNDQYYLANDIRRDVQTMELYDRDTGEWVGTMKVIIDTNERSREQGQPPQIVQQTTEVVDREGNGIRITTRTNPDGSTSTSEERFRVRESDAGSPDYNQEESHPKPPDPPQDPPSPPPSEGGTQGNPGLDGDNTSVAEFCQRRATHQSGVEQAARQDPSSMSVSCDDLVGAPSNSNCTLLEWARPQDFRNVLHPSTSNGCDTFQSPDDNRHCEPSNIQERLRGLTAQLWSLNVPEINICPSIVCDPAQAVELRTYTAGDIEFVCSVPAEAPVLEPSVEETPTLIPSVNTCPPGTYYAPGKGRCIQVSQGDEDDGGGSTGGECNLSIAACSSQGQSFNSNTCECEDIQ
jgi:hypothetical protein